MYATRNFKTKKALKEAVAAWHEAQTMSYAGVPTTKVEPVRLFAPGIGEPKANGTEYVEGPHYPAPHTWYAQVEVQDGIVVRVK